MPKITQRYGREAFEFRENSIVITISLNWINVIGDKAGDKNTEQLLNNTQASVLKEIRNNPNITKPRIAERLGLGKTTIDNAITVLKKYGYIERAGSNKSGYWKVLKY